jgi:hypothetical protein
LIGIQRAAAFQELHLTLQQLDSLCSLVKTLNRGVKRIGRMVKSLRLADPYDGYQLKQELSTLSTLFPRLNAIYSPRNIQLGVGLAPYLVSFHNLRKLDMALPNGLLLSRLLEVKGLKRADIRIMNDAFPVAAQVRPSSPINNQQRTLTLNSLEISAHHLDDYILSFLESVHVRCFEMSVEHGDIALSLNRLSPITILDLELWHDDSPLLASALSAFTNLRLLTLVRLRDHPLDSTFYSQTLSSLQQLESLTLDASTSLNSQDLLQALSACPPSFRKLELEYPSATTEATETGEGPGVESEEMEEIVVGNRLFDWPDGCRPADVREIIALGKRKGFEVVGSLAEAVRLTDELEKTMLAQTRLEAELKAMKA